MRCAVSLTPDPQIQFEPILASKSARLGLLRCGNGMRKQFWFRNYHDICRLA